MKVDVPDDEYMRISHESIYQSLFIEGRGALKRELVMCLCIGRAAALGRGRRTSRKGMSPRMSSSLNAQLKPPIATLRHTLRNRPQQQRKEGDLIIGTGRSAIGTLVERSSRSPIFVHLPRLEGWGEKPPVKNGPSFGGCGTVDTNGVLRQYFPNVTDLSRWPAEDLQALALAINNRPRELHDWRTPAEVFVEQLRSLQQPGVAVSG